MYIMCIYTHICIHGNMYKRHPRRRPTPRRLAHPQDGPEHLNPNPETLNPGTDGPPCRVYPTYQPCTLRLMT